MLAGGVFLHLYPALVHSKIANISIIYGSASIHHQGLDIDMDALNLTVQLLYTDAGDPLSHFSLPSETWA